MAYYMFVNHGWPPSKYDDLSQREKILLAVFADTEMKAREKNKWQK